MWFSEAGGQYTKYKKYTYDWGNDVPKSIAVDSTFSDEDAVILVEQNFMEASGTKTPFLQIHIEKKFRIKFLTKKGIENFSKFTIPESFDPTFDYKDIPVGNFKKQHRPRLFEINIKYFAARIIKENGNIEIAEITDRSKEERKMLDYNVNISHSYEFEITNLQVGDELEIAYKLELPYVDNWYLYYSTRVFFHGITPKQNYSFVLKTNEKLLTKLMFHNGCKADSIVKANKRDYYYFTRDNLPGVMYEVGSRPHKTLPYFVYDLNPSDDRFYYHSPYSMTDAVLPFWLYMLKLRESQAIIIQRRTEPIIVDKQFRKVRKFILNTTASIPEDQAYNKVLRIHHTIVDSFDYQDDYAYRAGLDTRLERLGDFTENRILREISRYKLYARTFNLLGVPYSTVYFMDKRIADMSQSYISPIIDNDFAFVMVHEEHPFYIYPKKSRFGYYTNELPFYWENTEVLFVNFYNLWSDHIADLRFVNTPTSTFKENFRISSVQATVNLEDKSVDFDVRLTLSGQFSTMMRGLYKYDITDSSINPLYKKKLWMLNSHTELLRSSITKDSKQYPFKFILNASYKSNGLIDESTDGVFSIPMNNWFNHITANGIVIKNRDLNFYPDFLFRDSYKYYLKFEKEVVILNADEFKVEFENELGNLKIELKQVQPNIYLLESDFVVNKVSVAPQNISDVVEIYNAIRELNGKSLKIKAKQ